MRARADLRGLILWHGMSLCRRLSWHGLGSPGPWGIAHEHLIPHECPVQLGRHLSAQCLPEMLARQAT